ncbi:hypothetical protein BJV78DRAFT_952444 [Lactifluus subvellereus]|nr:hypothetical protein BJV78DRAFT_952444 [Lactifluus subvellereus]
MPSLSWNPDPAYFRGKSERKRPYKETSTTWTWSQGTVLWMIELHRRMVTRVGTNVQVLAAVLFFPLAHPQNIQMGGGLVLYNERALNFFRFPSNGIPSTVRCDARMPSSALRPSACGFRFAKRTIIHHNHSYDIGPISWMKIMSGPSQQRGGNSAGILLMNTDLMGLSSSSRSRALKATQEPDTHTQKSCSRGNTFDARAQLGWWASRYPRKGHFILSGA